MSSLRARLFAAIGLVALVSLALALAIGSLLARRAVERNSLRDVSAQFDLMVERERVSPLPFARLPSLRPILERQDEHVVRVPLDGSSEYLPPKQATKVRRAVPVDGTVEVDGERYFYAARLVKGKAFVLLRPTSSTNSAWFPHIEGLLFGVLGAAALAGLMAFWLARAISRPVGRVARATQSLAAAEEPEPVPVEGPRELAQLAESFNDMASELTKARAAERSFLLSVSHELKTPLTAIRGYAEGLAEGAVPTEEAAATIEREAARLERLVRDVLDLARMRKSEFSIRHEPLDLREAALEAVNRYEPQARHFEITLEVDAPEPAPALGDADRVLQVVSNLVENALRLVPAGGTVRVVARPGTIAVEDTGPGLGTEELARAFERFYLWSRYGRERPVGTGLGLAIVKELAEGMGGSVDAVSEPGRLTRFTVRLPRTTIPTLAPPSQLTPA